MNFFSSIHVIFVCGCVSTIDLATFAITIGYQNIFCWAVWISINYVFFSFAVKFHALFIIC